MSRQEIPSRAAPSASLWERMARSPSPHRVQLTPARIAEAAVSCADSKGLDAVTIRSLADDLGTSPMALYRHVSGKDDILALMYDAVQPELSIAATTGAWRDVLNELAWQTRAMLLKHRWVAELSLRTRTALTPRRLAAIEQALLSLGEAGLDPDQTMQVVSTVLSYATGTASIEVVQSNLMKQEGWKSMNELRTALSSQMAWLLGTGNYPTYERYILEGQRKDDATWRFAFGLEAVLNGIAQTFDHSDGAPANSKSVAHRTTRARRRQNRSMT